MFARPINYDASGNITTYKYKTLTWEGRNLKSYGAYTYEYDENGLRTGKSQGSTEYYYNGTLLMGMVSGGNTLLFSYDAAGSVVSVNFNGTEYYYIKNAQSDIIGIANTDGIVVVTYNYDAWGKPTTAGSMSSTLGAYNPFRYRGYVYDTETGFYYLQSRYYDPSYGRFISPDLLMSTGQGVLGNNMYAYCLNNPVNGCDPCGTCFHRWDFWNDCEECGGKTLGQKLEDYYGRIIAIQFQQQQVEAEITLQQIEIVEYSLSSAEGLGDAAEFGLTTGGFYYALYTLGKVLVCASPASAIAGAVFSVVTGAFTLYRYIKNMVEKE